VKTIDHIIEVFTCTARVKNLRDCCMDHQELRVWEINRLVGVVLECDSFTALQSESVVWDCEPLDLVCIWNVLQSELAGGRTSNEQVTHQRLKVVGKIIEVSVHCTIYKDSVSGGINGVLEVFNHLVREIGVVLEYVPSREERWML
jgi:hypothetical protein